MRKQDERELIDRAFAERIVRELKKNSIINAISYLVVFGLLTALWGYLVWLSYNPRETPPVSIFFTVLLVLSLLYFAVMAFFVLREPIRLSRVLKNGEFAIRTDSLSYVETDTFSWKRYFFTFGVYFNRFHGMTHPLCDIYHFSRYGDYESRDRRMSAHATSGESFYLITVGTDERIVRAYSSDIYRIE